MEGVTVIEKLPIEPGKPPLTIEDIAKKPGLWGFTDTLQAIEVCSELAADFNRALEIANEDSNDLQKRSKVVLLGIEVDKYCFKSPGDAVPAEFATFGLLELPGGHLGCAAVLRDERTIITARHCLYNEKDGKPHSPLWPFIKFRPWSDPGRRIPLVSVRPPASIPANIVEEFRPINDVVEATLTSTVPGVPSVCWAKLSTLSDPIALVGFFPEGVAPEDADWTARTRVATGGSCLPLQVSDMCFAHFCSARPGFSGGPIFGAPDPSCPQGVRIIGLHLGASDGNNPDCGVAGANEAIAAARVAELLQLTPAS